MRTLRVGLSNALKCRSLTNYATDFIEDKLKAGATWWLATVNANFSKIPRELLFAIDDTTNLNESSHPAINKLSSTQRPLLEAIMGYDYPISSMSFAHCVYRACHYDNSVTTGRNKPKEVQVLANYNNTKSHRLRHNFNRSNAAGRRTQARDAVVDEAKAISASLFNVRAHHGKVKADLALLREELRNTKELWEDNDMEWIVSIRYNIDVLEEERQTTWGEIVELQKKKKALPLKKGTKVKKGKPGLARPGLPRPKILMSDDDEEESDSGSKENKENDDDMADAESLYVLRVCSATHVHVTRLGNTKLKLIPHTCMTSSALLHNPERRKKLALALLWLIDLIGQATQLYLEPYYNKENYHTSSLTGAAWLQELIRGHLDRVYHESEMRKHVFLILEHVY
jgi:hypothetical protein